MKENKYLVNTLLLFAASICSLFLVFANFYNNIYKCINMKMLAVSGWCGVQMITIAKC